MKAPRTLQMKAGPTRNLLQVISGITLYALPFILWVKSDLIIRWIDPVDPVPQGAMFCFGIGFLASCVLALSAGSLLIILGFQISIKRHQPSQGERKNT
ncbi:MAG: hypothetical protein AAF514_03545 [Verrucomicrobiota bacterium]